MQGKSGVTVNRGSSAQCTCMVFFEFDGICNCICHSVQARLHKALHCQASCEKKLTNFFPQHPKKYSPQNIGMQKRLLLLLHTF